MAEKKFSQFDPASTLTVNDRLVGLQGGVNVEATMQQIADFINQYAGFASGTWSPTFSNLLGISGSITLTNTSYMKINSFVIFSQNISFSANDSFIKFSSTLPVASNFSNANQLSLMGQVLTTDTSNAMDGDVVDAVADAITNLAVITINSTIDSGIKYARYSIIYEVI